MVRCNAPWVSAVAELDGTVRPCFFHPPYQAEAGRLAEVVNSAAAVRFRRHLRTARDPVCRRCVCSLNLPWSAAP
ncbi:MAG: SPASM domain-containing protein [Vicinamibacterales bacterium]